jgi:hypothetical protein
MYVIIFDLLYRMTVFFRASGHLPVFSSLKIYSFRHCNMPVFTFCTVSVVIAGKKNKESRKKFFYSDLIPNFVLYYCCECTLRRWRVFPLETRNRVFVCISFCASRNLY